ncbi:HXXEE domain-containing protein [Lactiplantibacillus daowaiensis]|uniref:HXXEE domain-containing protein n=1 Tax=Lactiplantibacillus daowaiensis TaxID=2559918 RepID=A0ABW1S2Q9_9LACO
MAKWLRRWFEFVVYIAGGYALILGLGQWSVQQKTLLLGLILIHLHFFEEFGLPGGFAWGGIKVEKGHVDADVTTWPLNQLSALWGNEWFAIVVYLLPLFRPQWHWLVLAGIIFAFAELMMHWVIFNLGLHSWYNPGSFTAFLLTVPATWYLWQVVPTGLFNWWDLMIAIVWLAFNYWVAFRSPIFKWFNRHTKYTFSRDDLTKAEPYMTKFNVKIDDFKNMP